jgi:hypothetical protein
VKCVNDTTVLRRSSHAVGTTSCQEDWGGVWCVSGA